MENNNRIISYKTKKEFTGNNAKNVENFRDLLINNEIISENETLELISENEIVKSDGIINENAIPILLKCPPDEEHEEFYTQKFYSLNQVENIDIKTPQSSDIEAIEQDAPLSSNEIIEGQIILPPFTVISDGELKSFSNCIIQEYDKDNEEYKVATEKNDILKVPKKTMDSILNYEASNQQLLQQEREQEAAIATGIGLVFQDLEHNITGTILPEFSLNNSDSLDSGKKVYKDFVLKSYNEESESYVATNGDTDLILEKNELQKIIAQEKQQKPIKQKVENIKQVQYDDYFEPRLNKAANFIHNFSVYCRKEANSPVESINVAKSIIDTMGKKEKKRTKQLLKSLKGKNQSINELLVDIYHESIKEVPLNESYIERNYPNKFKPRNVSDTISDLGKNISNFEDLQKINKINPELTKDRNLKIGQTLKNITIPVEKTFGKGKESIHFDQLTVVSSSRINNTITLKDGDKSLIELPREKFLKIYHKIEKREMKKENQVEKKSHKINREISFDIC